MPRLSLDARGRIRPPFMEMLKEQDVALMAGFTFTEELAHYAALGNCHVIQVIHQVRAIPFLPSSRSVALLL